jgi:hypothetical protein
LIVGSSNLITPQAMLPAIVPAFVYLALWYVLAGLIHGLIGIETRSRSFAVIDKMLELGTAAKGSL